MSESTEYTTDTTPVVTTEPAEPTVTERKPNRLYQVAAWVGVVAGTVFVVAVIFFSGFVLGKNAGGHGDFGRHGESGMFERPGRGADRDGPGRPGMMWPGGPGQGPGGPGGFGPGQMGPGGPGQMGPGGPGQGSSAPQTTPTR